MEELPFEQFETIRDEIEDLAYNPHPASSKRSKKTPGTRLLKHDRFRLTYSVREEEKAITMIRLEKRR